MRKTLALLTLLLAFAPSLLTAQAAKSAAPAKAEVVLIYVDNDLEMDISDPAGNKLVVSEGMKIPVGAVIKTKNTTAELQLRPNKSIIKLSSKTTFSVKALKEGDAAGTNDFALTAGKIRTVAAKLTGATAPGYIISTPTANCGVRGTDFAMKYDAEAKQDWVCVQEGKVEFTNALTGATVAVSTGQFANTFDSVFQAGVVTADKLAELFSDVGFVKLDPKDVQGKEIAATTQEKPAETTGGDTNAAPAAEPAAEDPMMAMLKKIFGLEVGSITIDGITYSKAVLSPVVAFDGFKLGLYLPIVYSSDMFNPNDWYHPEGNDEWSFGTDKSDLGGKVGDFATDLALKIKFLEWGVQGSDPFYLKVGNLKTMTLGHGTVMRNFANDQDFPAIRKIGLNAGVKFGSFALEGMADDIANPTVVGGRFAFDLIGDQVALGFQTAADLKLANSRDLAAFDAAPSDFGDPVLLVGGVDLQLFKINAGGAFRALAFADFNTLAPYFRQSDKNSLYYPKVTEGFDFSTVYHDGQLGSFGTEAGVDGNIAIVRYRFSFQAERGLYTNGIFQGNYYRDRLDLLKSVLTYTYGDLTANGQGKSVSSQRETIDKTLNMGVFGSFGFDVGILALDGAYRWPFELRGDGSIGPSDSDSLKIALTIPKGKIPIVELSGGVSYERTGFVPSLRDHVDLFNASTVFKGEVVYGLTKGLDLVVTVGTATMRDAAGNVIYTSSTSGIPKVGPTVGIDTKISL